MFQLILSLLALLVIALTMFVSASDLTLKGMVRWHVRRVGFVVAGAGAVGLMLAELFAHYRPGWFNTMLEVGIALVLMTTPYQPPWHKWIWKGDAGGVA